MGHSTTSGRTASAAGTFITVRAGGSSAIISKELAEKVDNAKFRRDQDYVGGEILDVPGVGRGYIRMRQGGATGSGVNRIGSTEYELSVLNDAGTQTVVAVVNGGIRGVKKYIHQRLRDEIKLRAGWKETRSRG